MNPAVKKVADAINPATIEVTPDLHLVRDAAIAALARHADVYQREGRLVQPMRVSGPVGWARGADATPMLRVIPMSTLACELARVAVWTRYNARAKAPTQVEPPERVVASVHDAGHWPGMRTLHAIVEAPMLRADGSVLQTPGYDAATGVIYDPGRVDFPPVPDSPTIDDARAALVALLEPFEEFPFASGADALVPVAAILTSLAMGALAGENFPCITFDANVQGTGKTLCADAIAWVLTGREVPKQTFPADPAELEKVLGGCALAATPMICLDNINAVFGGDALENRITCRGTSSFRILGKTGNPKLPWRTIVLASGNNIRTTVDMRRRILRCRLVSKVENPEERDIRRPDLRGFILERRPQLVVAGLTLLRGFIAAGSPAQGVGRMGNFEAWSALVAGALKWASGVDVLDARMPSAAVVDPVTEAYADFLGSFVAEADASLETPWVLGRDYAARDLAAMPCWDALIARDDRNRGVRVAGALRQMTERPIDGRQVVPGAEDRHRKQRRYRVVAL